MSASPEMPYPEFWPDAWRFAFLMTGSAAAAQAVIHAVVPRAAERLTQMRDERQARRWLFSNLRERCKAAAPVDVPDGTSGPAEAVARLFSALPEEERSALALFYLRRFSPAELAEVLELSPVALGRLLGVARQLLARGPEWRGGSLPNAPMDNAVSPPMEAA